MTCQNKLCDYPYGECIVQIVNEGVHDALEVQAEAQMDRCQWFQEED